MSCLIRAFLVLIAVQAVSIVAYSNDQCPAVTCDCNSLPFVAWQRVCAEHESQIKDACIQNSGKPTSYCSLSGPSAKPLPLSTKFRKIEPISFSEVDGTNKKIAALYWAFHADRKTAANKITALKFGEAIAMLKIVDKNLDNLLDAQQRVTSVWVVSNKKAKAIEAWKKYAEDTVSVAQTFSDDAALYWKKYEASSEASLKKAYRLLTMRLLRISGKAFEIAAYASASADNQALAAGTWKKAAGIANRAFQHSKQLASSEKHLKFYRKQAAARLHRASYHYALVDDLKSAKNNLKLADSFASDNTLMKQIAVAEEKYTRELAAKKAAELQPEPQNAQGF